MFSSQIELQSLHFFGVIQEPIGSYLICFFSVILEAQRIEVTPAFLPSLPWIVKLLKEQFLDFTTPLCHPIFLPPRFWVVTSSSPTRVSLSTTREEKKESLGSRLHALNYIFITWSAKGQREISRLKILISHNVNTQQ